MTKQNGKILTIQTPSEHGTGAFLIQLWYDGKEPDVFHEEMLEMAEAHQARGARKDRTPERLETYNAKLAEIAGRIGVGVRLGLSAYLYTGYKGALGFGETSDERCAAAVMLSEGGELANEIAFQVALKQPGGDFPAEEDAAVSSLPFRSSTVHDTLNECGATLLGHVWLSLDETA